MKNLSPSEHHTDPGRSPDPFFFAEGDLTRAAAPTVGDCTSLMDSALAEALGSLLHRVASLENLMYCAVHEPSIYEEYVRRNYDNARD